jgi:hypothetical protein
MPNGKIIKDETNEREKKRRRKRERQKCEAVAGGRHPPVLLQNSSL